MKAYILSTSAISPQPTFGEIKIPGDMAVYSGTRMSCIEPDYKNRLDAKLIRRMSRILRMGAAAAMECMHQSGLAHPGAIITGTALGCMQDTVVFLKKMVEHSEEALAPTAFIQSTHNTVGAQVALLLHSHVYNNTFVHQGHSFEMALTDALLLLQEKDAETVLVGGIDEMTDESHALLSRFGLFRNGGTSNETLLTTTARGTMGGEGASFLLLANEPTENTSVCLDAVSTFCRPSGFSEVESNLAAFLKSQSFTFRDLDLVILGKNGDTQGDEIYSFLEGSLLQGVDTCPYKHLCGEYPTSGAFALWFAQEIIQSGQIPFRKKELQPKKEIKKVLIYNHDPSDHHSMILLSAC